MARKKITDITDEIEMPVDTAAVFDDVPDNGPLTEGLVMTDVDEKKPHIPVPQQLAVLAIIMLLLFSGSITPRVIGFFQKAAVGTPILHAATSTPTIDVLNQQSQSTATSSAFDHITITGKSAYVWDVRNQRALFKKNENEALPLASVTKLMTALLSNELLAGTSTVTITAEAVAQDGNSGFKVGEQFSLQTLTDFSLMSSSNDGAFALATAAGKTLDPANPTTAFVKAMNIRAGELGLHETTYINPSGLDISTTQAGAFGSTKDMAYLMEYIITHNPGLLHYTSTAYSKMYDKSGHYLNADNTNTVVDSIPGLIGSKTGYTDLAGGNLVIAFNAGLDRPIIIAVLGSTEQSRFTDVMKLVKAAQQYITNQ